MITESVNRSLPNNPTLWSEKRSLPVDILAKRAYTIDTKRATQKDSLLHSVEGLQFRDGRRGPPPSAEK